MSVDIPATFCPAFSLEDNDKPNGFFEKYLMHFENVWDDEDTIELMVENGKLRDANKPNSNPQ